MRLRKEEYEYWNEHDGSKIKNLGMKKAVQSRAACWVCFWVWVCTDGWTYTHTHIPNVWPALLRWGCSETQEVQLSQWRWQGNGIIWAGFHRLNISVWKNNNLGENDWVKSIKPEFMENVKRKWLSLSVSVQDLWVTGRNYPVLFSNEDDVACSGTDWQRN